MTTIAIFAQGDMGAGVAERLGSNGQRVVTCLAGRSAASRQRAQGAGMIALSDFDALVGESEVVLSICPPGVAEAIAAEFAAAIGRARAKPIYVDCNAISPMRMAAIAARFDALDCPVVDVGIVGRPPRGRDPGPRFYASGPDAARLASLLPGIDSRIVSPAIGDASALKMCFATLTKGLDCLLASSWVAAQRHNVLDRLMGELRASWPDVVDVARRQLPNMPAKAYRWEAEMHEIADTFESVGVPGTIMRGAGELCARIAALDIAKAPAETDVATLIAALASELAAAREAA